MFTPEQHDRFMDHFHSLSETYATLMPRVYDFEQAADDIESVVRRMGNICYRIMMVLGAMRLANAEEIPDELECNQDDFDSVILYSELFMHHTMIHYDEMLQATGIVGDGEDEPNMDSKDLMNDNQRALWEVLPNHFIMRDAAQYAKDGKISMRTVEKYIKFYCDMGMMKRVGRGSYEKVVTQEEDEETENS